MKPPQHLVVERFEGDWAVVQDDAGQAVWDLPRWMLPKGTRAGDWLLVERAEEETGAVHLCLRRDPEARRNAAAEIEARHRRLQSLDPGGDLVL